MSERPRLLRTMGEARDATDAARRANLRIGLVPTMGALHHGHASLIEAARRDCPYVVVSVFVNPTQFAPGEDLEAYPRTFEQDLVVLRSAGADAVFAPTASEMYARDATTRVHVSELTTGLCGPFRPGHFDGVATVVVKLFHAVPADAAYFGEKDFQQLQVVRRLVRDLNIPIEIVGCPTVREPDGLAMSSRNRYLSEVERLQARSLSAALFAARERIRGGETDARVVVQEITQRILQARSARIEYVEVVDPESLRPVERIGGTVRILLAVRIGHCRLIDNVSAPI